MGAADEIVGEVTGWPGVTVAPHRFGGVEFRYGRRELGHLHGDRLADIPFTRRVRDDLIAQGRVERHAWLPDSGWATRRIAGPRDVRDVVELLRGRYEHVRARSQDGGE